MDMKLNKEERKMFSVIYEKAIHFSDRLEENGKENIPLLKEYGDVKTIGDAMDAIILSLHIIGETIIGKEV